MGLITASPAAVAEVRTTLRALSLAHQDYLLYQPDHPRRREAIREVLASFRRLGEALGAPPVLFAGRRGFYLGPTLLPRASLTLYRLLEAFERAGVESLEVRPGVTGEDVDALLRLLAAEGPPADTGAIGVNTVRPVGDAADGGGGMRDLLRSYAAGLSFLREAGARVSAGHPADAEGASVLAGRLTEHIVTDPAQALLLTTIKSYDEYTYHHMLNVGILAMALGHALGLRDDQVVALGVGGLLHDIGKITVPREILHHVGPLDEEQWRLIQRHPVEGAGLVLAGSGDLHHPALAMILEHHAAYDLSGYPPLSGRAHPSVPARIVAVADCFDALTSKRQYRRAEERRQALSILSAGAGRGYDPRVVRAFLRLLGVFPVGSLVRLTDGTVGMVVRPGEATSRPVVRLLLDPTGSPCHSQEVDLSERGADGSYRRSVERSVNPGEAGVDMLAVLSTGRVEAGPPEPVGPREDGGLVHEPAHGEPAPPGYVDTHALT